MNIYMEKAKQNADNGIKNKEGGPFGAIFYIPLVNLVQCVYLQ